MSDWSSDVCSSDLYSDREPARCSFPLLTPDARGLQVVRSEQPTATREQREVILLRGREPSADRKSVVSGKSVSVRVDLGGRRIIKRNIYRSRFTAKLNAHLNTIMNKSNNPI